MDGDFLTVEPSDRKEPPTLAEIFADVFPYYLAMGMTYDEFWHGCPSLVRDYRKAYEIKQRNEEWGRHRLGAYVFTALLSAAPVMRAFGKGKVEPGKYPEQPWPLTEKEAREQQEARERENYFKAIAQRKAASEQRKRMRAEEAAKKEAGENGGD